jgi:cytochrome c553
MPSRPASSPPDGQSDADYEAWLDRLDAYLCRYAKSYAESGTPYPSVMGYLAAALEDADMDLANAIVARAMKGGAGMHDDVIRLWNDHANERPRTDA